LYGYPRQGPDRELKKVIEKHWAGSVSSEALQATAVRLRAQRLFELREAGIDEICSNDFSLYDHMLDTAWMVGAIPERHRRHGAGAYFAAARGAADTPPLEMTKWFDTNYHYLVPELGPDTTFAADSGKPVAEFSEARELGMTTRPVLVGPVTFLLLSKPTVDGFAPLDLLDALLPVYASVLTDLADAGAEWVQLDEPALVQDQPAHVLDATRRAYDFLATHRPKLLVASYFDALGDALPVLAATAIDGLAIDFTAAASLEQLEAIGGLPGRRLVAGVVDGRNVWANDLRRSLSVLQRLGDLAGQVDVAPSCSLLHVPLDVAAEQDHLNPAILPWLAFAAQKLDEVATLARGLRDGEAAIAGELAAIRRRLDDRARSPITRDAAVRARAAAISATDLVRKNPYPVRHEAQQGRLGLPRLPTTTIGSFPQTRELRRARADRAAGKITAEAYDAVMAQEVKDVIARQEQLGVDVLVHGEPERNDMVQYFAEQLAGFEATRHGWVQSYGTRFVRPPIIVGDVSRPAPMTVEWARFAQQQTSRPVKGMLTGPVTMLAWSFVRDDQPLGETARQVALALRDEVADLEAAGIAIIQVDEPALRETLPLRRDAQAAYLKWAVDAFRLATSAVGDDTQIHTHMCYAEFGDVLDAIIATDADVTSLEAARSGMAIVHDLARAGYPREVGPGVWDIHSPRVPSTDEMAALLRRAASAQPVDRLWVNPDCGLKTRGYDEVLASLEHMVAAAREVRAELG
jgi:5-methyltetrahydropteroyltriglutamate--homocysteine methyltransferase